MLKTKTSLIELSTSQKWFMVAVASLLFFYNFTLLNCINPLVSQLMHDFSISATQMGILSSMYFYGICITVIPAGLLLDHISSIKSILLCSMVVHILSIFGFAFSHSFFMAGFFRFLLGIAGGFAGLSCIYFASKWLPAKQMAFANGFILALGMFGGMLAQTPTELLSQHFGWRYTLVIFSIIGILIFAIIWLVVIDPPQKQKVRKDKNDFLKNIYYVVANKKNWLAGLYITSINLPIFVLGTLWGSLYLTQAHSFSIKQASSIISMLFLGILIGSPLIGFLSDKFRRRLIPMKLASVFILIIILSIIYLKNISFVDEMVLFFLLGLFSGAQTISYALITEINITPVIAKAISIALFLGMTSGFIFQPLFGWLIDLNWNHTIVHNLNIYSPENFKIAMLMFPISFIVSLLLAFLLKETYCKRIIKQ